MVDLYEYKLDDSSTLYTREHNLNWDSNRIVDNRKISENWKDIPTKDARNLCFLNTFSLAVDIRLIQNVGNYKAQRILNEYTCGDIVHGFLEVRNLASESIEFDSLCLCLEGRITVINPRSGSRNIKKILRMSYGDSPQITKANDIELLSDRILRPHTQYRLEFAFKIPDRLSDQDCKNGIPQHYSVPPSLGIDKLHKQCRYRSLEIDKVLGYARANEIGSPIWAWDQTKDLSISYSIEATIVGKGKHGGENSILKSSEHLIRIIPPSTLQPTGEIDPNQQFIKSRFFYRKIRHSSFFGQLFEWFSPFIDQSDKSGTIVISAPVPSRSLAYHSSELMKNQNSFVLKNHHEQLNRLRIQNFISSNSYTPLKEICVSLHYMPIDDKNPTPPKLHSIYLELLCITGKSNHHLPSNLNCRLILNQQKMDRLRKESTEFSDLDIDITSLSDAFRSHRIRKWYTKKRWSSKGSEYFQELLINLEHPKHFCKTLVPNFVNCTCFRYYCIRINIIFEKTLGKTHLDIPINILNTFF